MSRQGRAWSCGAVVIGLALLPGAARADVTKTQCIQANTSGQDARRDGRLSAARQQFRICADPGCPGLVRDDCARRLDDVEAAQPTILFDIKDGSGHDAIGVEVTIDDHPLVGRLDGTALSVDPGDHVFVFTALDHASVRQTFVLKEGEKGRRERVVVGKPPPAVTPEPPPPEPLSPAPPAPVDASDRGLGAQKILGLTAGGVGIAGLAVGSVFGVMTLSAKSQQTSACPSVAVCANHAQAVDDHTTGMTDSTIATVGFIAGAALLLGGTVLFVTSSPPAEPRASARAVLVPTLGPQGAGLLLQGRF